MTFLFQIEIDFHVACHAISHLVQKFHCLAPGCTVSYVVYRQVVEHMAIKHPDIVAKLEGTETLTTIYGTFTCPEDGCNKIFKLKRSLFAHRKNTHMKPIKSTCSHCGITLSCKRKSSIQLHEDKCRGVEYTCSQCSYKSNSRNALKLHLRHHTGQTFPCATCNKAFSTKKRLKVHQETHNSLRCMFLCGVCGKVFVHKDALKKHKRRFHDDVKNKEKCSFCSYESKMSADMKKHILLVHTKVYHCQLCSFKTNNKLWVNRHLDYHAPGKIYSCPYSNCYFKAETQQELSDHLTDVHKVWGKHQCPICCKYFKKKTLLVRHIVSHTGEKVYKCAECPASFMSHTSYYNHRHKTGHDKKREGILSVPQNVVIQYYDDGNGDTNNQCEKGEPARVTNKTKGRHKSFVQPSISADKIQCMYLDVQGSMHVIQDRSYLTKCLREDREDGDQVHHSNIDQSEADAGALSQANRCVCVRS